MGWVFLYLRSWRWYRDVNGALHKGLGFFCKCLVHATPGGRLQALCSATVLQWLSSRCCWCKWGIWVPPLASHTSQTEKQHCVADSPKAWGQIKSGLCIIVAIRLGEFRPQLRSKSSRVNTRCCFSWTFQTMSCTYIAAFLLDQTLRSGEFGVFCIQRAALSASMEGAGDGAC